MAKFAVTIVESLVRTVVVEANDVCAAEEKVMKAYDAGRIVLTSEDFFDYTLEDAYEYDEDMHAFCEVIE